MTTFTASEVREKAAAFCDPCIMGVHTTGQMLAAFADRLEADEKAVPVAWTRQDTINDGDGRPIGMDEPRVHWCPMRPDDELGWVPLYTHPAPADAEGLAEALRKFDGAFHKELADLARIPEDDRGRINRSFVMDCVVGLRRCWDKLSTSRAHCAQAQPQNDGLHPATAELVDRFSSALREKLLEAQRKYGYSNNWQRSDWIDECRQHLRKHLEKGDPRDVAAYCAFLWHHGASTTKRTLMQLRADCEAQPPAASVSDEDDGDPQGIYDD